LPGLFPGEQAAGNNGFFFAGRLHCFSTTAHLFSTFISVAAGRITLVVILILILKKPPQLTMSMSMRKNSQIPNFETHSMVACEKETRAGEATCACV